MPPAGDHDPHVGSDGSTVEQRMTAHGYNYQGTNPWATGENTYWGFGDGDGDGLPAESAEEAFARGGGTHSSSIGGCAIPLPG